MVMEMVLLILLVVKLIWMVNLIMVIGKEKE